LLSILDKDAQDGRVLSNSVQLRLGLFFKKRIGRLKILMFVGTGLEEHPRAGAETFDSPDIMFAKPAPLVQSARVSEDMAPACSVDVELDRLLADRALRGKRVRSPPHQQLYELHGPCR